MAQQTLKELTYDGKKVYVEVAKRDSLGRVIKDTYATSDELTTGLGTKQGTLSPGTGISINGSTISVKLASASQVGGISVGNGLAITAEGVLSATAQSWSTITNKPFTEFASADFTVSSGVVSIVDTKWATKSHVANTYLSLDAHNTFASTVASTYEPKISSSHKISWDYISGGPSKVSDLTNDSGFITSSVNNLTNYYKKSETYTKSEIQGFLDNINSFEYVIASSLDTASADTMYKIYLIPAANAQNQNVKDEYVTIRTDNGEDANPRYTYAWEQIGSTSVDLSTYLKSDAVMADNAIVLGDGATRKVKSSGITISSSTLANAATSVPTSSAVYSALSGKQDTLTSSNAGTGISISNGVISSVIAATDVILDY